MNDKQLIIAHLRDCGCKTLDKKEIDKNFKRRLSHSVIRMTDDKLVGNQINNGFISEQLIKRAFEFISAGNIKIDDITSKKISILSGKTDFRTDDDIKKIPLPKTFTRYFKESKSDVSYFLVGGIFKNPNNPEESKKIELNEDYIEVYINKYIGGKNEYLINVITNNKVKYKEEINFFVNKYSIK